MAQSRLSREGRAALFQSLRETISVSLARP